MKSVIIQALSFLCVVLLSGVSSESVNPQTNAQETQTCYCLKGVIKNIHNPVGVIFHEGFQDNRAGRNNQYVLVVEQRGVVERFRTSDGERVDNFMDIQSQVFTTDQYGESRGLLSVVLDPNYNQNGKIYAYYIRKVEGEDYAYVSMFRAQNSVINRSSEMFLLRIHQPFQHGNGGPMLFGDDGFLYIFVGDGGETDDPKGHAQNKSSFLGSVLRIDVSGGQDFTRGASGVAKTFSIPRSNPFLNDIQAAPEVYANGVRNMWGCTVDTAERPGGSGRIFCAETGTNRFDEINIIESGKNYGWNLKEGNECFKIDATRTPATCGVIENEGVPIYTFTHNNSHALVGGHVYRGKDFSWMAGKGFYIFGDVITSNVHFLEPKADQSWNKGDWQPCPLDKCPSDSNDAPLTHLLAFGQDDDNELYLVMSNDLIASSKNAGVFLMKPHRSGSIGLSSSLITIVSISFVVSWALSPFSLKF